MNEQDPLTGSIIGAAIEVHRKLGPGLLESVYAKCLWHELGLRGIPFLKSVPVPIIYKDLRVENGLILDLLVGDRVIVELKSVDALHPVHHAQLLSYMRLSNIPLGLLMNFNVPVLKDGIKRLIN
jgi:GxxExxY protein